MLQQDLGVCVALLKIAALLFSALAAWLVGCSQPQRIPGCLSSTLTLLNHCLNTLAVSQAPNYICTTTRTMKRLARYTLAPGRQQKRQLGSTNAARLTLVRMMNLTLLFGFKCSNFI